MGKAKWTANQQRWMLNENAVLYGQFLHNENEYYLGMDFSMRSTGIAVLDKDGEYVESVAIETAAKDGTQLERLTMITDHVQRLLKEYPPAVVSCEAVTVSKNIKSMMGLCTVSGAVLQLVNDVSDGLNYDLPYLLFPNVSSLKKAAADDGSANKGTMQMEVYAKWGVKTSTDDEADAIVAAKLGYKMDTFFKQYEAIMAGSQDEDADLMDICKNRHEEFYSICEDVGIEREEVDALVGIFTGSSGGGSGMNQMRENDNKFYYAARKRLKER